MVFFGHVAIEKEGADIIDTRVGFMKIKKERKKESYLHSNSFLLFVYLFYSYI